MPFADEPVKAGFSAPKKNYPRAVKRNRLKRLLRETWRLRKHELTAVLPPEKALHVFFLVGRTETFPDFETIEKSMSKCVKHLVQICTEQTSPKGNEESGG